MSSPTFNVLRFFSTKKGIFNVFLIHSYKVDIPSQMPWVIPTQADTHQKWKWFGGAILQFLMGQEASGMELF